MRFRDQRERANDGAVLPILPRVRDCDPGRRAMLRASPTTAGGTRPLCGLQTAQEMVRQELLVIRNGRYEITPKGLRVGEPRSPLKD